ncbi:phosphoglucosamine mutase [Alkalibacter saccharofermentans]|uniref:Phosphoglucosamine mutase n=1 Tax=Alkalibacter saccharofermentans DSM 14828 TaxID=1120975 RepID=A0A1M4WYB6_9FIRM|nr:phosphoglucosamine mutase [Alkalibacter saccharofermentans]SHE86281.1 phosphoglucosamine mutase [Alkalibacter saccharofermentans DSM 14828]
MGNLFGTDGVRGVANSELTPQLAFELGRAGAYVLATNAHKPKFVIGKDTRISGDLLEAALTAGILSVGGEVIKAGVIPTPGVAILTRELKADAGVVISASHNPAEFNGIKFFNGEGFKLRDEIEDKIEELIEFGFEYPVYIGDGVGVVTEMNESTNVYEEFVLSTIDTDLNGLKIVLDCANGAAYKIAPEVFEKAGAEVIVIGNDPDGININKNCGSTHLERLQSEVLERNADFGLAFDGDADRMLAVDEKGNVVDGDQILNIFAYHMKKQKCLKNDTVVITVMSNMGLDLALDELKCKSVKTKVGDRYVLEEMLDKGYNLGGEQSGHIILLDHNTTGDGVLSGVQLAAIIKKENKSLGELSAMMSIFPQVLVNAKVNNNKKYGYLEDEIIQGEIRKMEIMLEKKGRVLIRPSGTEPLVRVMLEGENLNEIKTMAENLADMIVNRLA